MYNNDKANLEALSLIDKVLDRDDYEYLEAVAEKGLILMRLGRYQEARDMFSRYKTSVDTMKEAPGVGDGAWAIKMINKCDQYINASL